MKVIQTMFAMILVAFILVPKASSHLPYSARVLRHAIITHHQIHAKTQLRLANATLHRANTELRFVHSHASKYNGNVLQKILRNHVWLRDFGKQQRYNALARLVPPKPAPAIYAAQASWYGPGFYGNTMACGGTLQTWTNGVANRSLACGTRLYICYGGRCEHTYVVDRGPYVSGRDFDLTGWLASALGFGGLGTIYWRYD